MTDAVMSDLVQRNAKSLVQYFGHIKTEKVAVTRGKHVWKTVSFT